MKFEYNLNMQVIKENYDNGDKVSNVNLLHPDFYDLIDCPKAWKLIGYYDTQKLKRCQRQKSKGGLKENNWWTVNNFLHKDKKFVGGFERPPKNSKLYIAKNKFI